MEGGVYGYKGAGSGLSYVLPNVAPNTWLTEIESDYYRIGSDPSKPTGYSKGTYSVCVVGDDMREYDHLMTYFEADGVEIKKLTVWQAPSFGASINLRYLPEDTVLVNQSRQDVVVNGNLIPSPYLREEEPTLSIFEATLDSYEKMILCAPSGSMVRIEGDDGFNALPDGIINAFMKKGDVDLEFSYSYKEKAYTVRIPAGTQVETGIPWYGPMYLWAHYGADGRNRDS